MKNNKNPINPIKSMHTYPRRRLALGLVVTTCLLPSTSFAVTRSWTGTVDTNAKWSIASLWGGTLPTTADDAWFNVANNYALIDSTVNAAGRQIIIGRNAANTSLNITGGSVTSAGEFFIGQYAGSSGVVDMSDGTLNAGSHFNIGATGIGAFHMSGGVANIGGRLYLNRYPGATASGYADISGGSVSATDLTIGAEGTMFLDNTTLQLAGDERTLVNGYLSTGQIASWFGSYAPVSVAYDATANKTTVAVANGRKVGISAFTAAVLGERPITYDYTGVRRIKPAPPVASHPRIYMESDDANEVKTRLETTVIGQEILRMVQAHTLLLRSGSGAYNAMPVSFKLMPDNTARIDNVGLYDRSVVYNQLVAGTTTAINTMGTNNDSTGTYVLSGEMALEALECFLYKADPAMETRAGNLGKAMNTWALWALAQPDFGIGSTTWKFGGHSIAIAYDFNHWKMTPVERNNVRKAVAHVMKGFFASGSSSTQYVGYGVTPEAFATNWVTLDTFKLVAACAIEGEVTTADAGYSSADLDSYVNTAASSLHKFFTYGWFPTGAPLEGQGKNYTFGAHLIAMARRGYDFFGHPHVKAYTDRWVPAVIEPYGYKFTKYDVLGGNDSQLEMSDLVGAIWMYPKNPKVDFAWRNRVQTKWTDGGGNAQLFYDARKFGARSGYGNSLVPAAVFATDIASTETWTAHNSATLGSLDYLDDEGGTLVSRSAYDPDATRLMVHIRQDFGGHTTADRNSFTLGALGRTFINHHNIQDSIYHSVVHVDDKAMKVTEKEGRKMRIPAKVSGWKIGADSSFISGDATYAYSNEWKWRNDGVIESGFVADNAKFNDFRRTGNKIVEAFGNTSFNLFPHWVSNGLEGIQKKPYQPMRQVYRTIGLVRGEKPYVFLVDDIRKDDATHNYKWFATVASGLDIVTGVALPIGCDAATDVVLQETAGNRWLLVRVLRADGTPQQLAGTPGSSLAYLETLGTYKRLVIERAGVVEPNFRVMLFPFRAGDPLPVSGGSENNLTITVGGQTDSIQFYPRSQTVAGQTVTINEFTISRGATTVVDFRDQVEPAAAR